MSKTVFLMLAIVAIAALFALPVSAKPDVYYYGDTCTVPPAEYFLENPYGIPGFMSYSLDVVPSVWQDGTHNPNGNHYTGLDDKTPYKLGISRAVQDKLALIGVVYCYTLPDETEVRTFTKQSPALKLPTGAIVIDGKVFVLRPGGVDGQAYEAA